jgi:hypothetical protein
MLKQPILRDRKYLDWLRRQTCIVTGLRGSEHDAVDPAHIGTLGKGIKSPDDEALPLLHSMHAEAHQHGEISMFRKHAPDWLIRAALRAYARELYRSWKAGTEKAA